jgi:hypothetical protein
MTVLSSVFVIDIPTPAVNLSCLFCSSVLISWTIPVNVRMLPPRVSIFWEFVPTKPRVLLRTLSKVVIPRLVKPGIDEVFTTTASASVIGTNSVLF